MESIESLCNNFFAVVPAQPDPLAALRTRLKTAYAEVAHQHHVELSGIELSQRNRAKQLT